MVVRVTRPSRHAKEQAKTPPAIAIASPARVIQTPPKLAATATAVDPINESHA